MDQKGYRNRAKSGARAQIAAQRRAGAGAQRAKQEVRTQAARTRSGAAPRTGVPRPEARADPTFLLDLAREAPPPQDGILSRTVFEDSHVKAVVFGFAAGQELSEHTASRPAILHFVRGSATLTLGPERVEAQAGSFVHMPAGLRHAVHASAPTVMLLLLLKG